MKPDARTGYAALASGDLTRIGRTFRPQTKEPTMDMRAIQKTRAAARLAAEIALTDELNRTVQRLPEAHLFPHEQTARDIALGVAMRAFASPLAERQRKALALIRQAEFITDPEEQADIYGELEMIFYGLKRDAEGRANERDPVTGRRVQP